MRRLSYDRPMPTRLLTTGMLVAMLVASRPLLAAGAPDEAARAFYAVYISARVSGVPSRRDQLRFAPTISERLASALLAASDAEARHLKSTKNQEPPLWEGDVFSSLFEGATRAEVGNCAMTGERAQCDVTLAYRDAATRNEQTWHDRVVLVRERGVWLVDDIAYGATWSFGPKGTLRANLEEIARYPAR